MQRAYFLTLIPIAMIVVGQTLAKFGVQKLEGAGTVVNAFIVAAYILLILRGFVWVLILKKVKLSVAYPMVSLTYVLILLISRYLFSEPIAMQQVAGSVTLVAGVFLVGYGEMNKKKG
jgi:undecaprenyl phosphate-alpha-L-ara4N flippase subunit ArnE